MKEVLDKQTAILERVEKNLSQDKLIQLSQVALQHKTDKDINKDEGETHQRLGSIREALMQQIKEMRKLASEESMKKVFEQIKVQTKTLTKLTPVQTGAILDKSRGNREFKTIGSRLQSAGAGVKDFFTGRGFLDKTGIAKRGSGGLVSEYLDAKEDRSKYAKARIEAGDPTVRLHGVEKATKIFERQRGEQQQLRRDQSTDERKIESYKKLGISEKQIEKSSATKRLGETAIKLAKVDPALRPEGFDVASGMIKTTA